MEKSGHEMGLLKDEEYETLNSILKECSDVTCFEFDGTIFLGDKIEIVKRYIKLNPSKRFYVWMHDNIQILQPANNIRK